ncbi:ammonium transporter, partial [Acidovorax delafieldii 2AN]
MKKLLASFVLGLSLLSAASLSLAQAPATADAPPAATA